MADSSPALGSRGAWGGFKPTLAPVDNWLALAANVQQPPEDQIGLLWRPSPHFALMVDLETGTLKSHVNR